jgi:hypothetical protein
MYIIAESELSQDKKLPAKRGMNGRRIGITKQ